MTAIARIHDSILGWRHLWRALKFWKHDPTGQSDQRDVHESTKASNMTITVTIEEAQARLREFIKQLVPGEELIITEEQRPVAHLRLQSEVHKRPPPGLGKGSIVFMSNDFDEPLEELQDYSK